LARDVREWGAEVDIWALQENVTGEWRKFRNDYFMVCPHQILFGW